MTLTDAKRDLAHDFIAQAAEAYAAGNLDGWAASLRVAAEFATEFAQASRPHFYQVAGDGFCGVCRSTERGHLAMLDEGSVI